MTNQTRKPDPSLFLVILIVLIYHSSIYLYHHPNLVVRVFSLYILSFFIFYLSIPIPVPCDLEKLETSIALKILENKKSINHD